ncbi:MAG: xanthine dehydrogenase family protein molybdopterin-binding subunit [Candidatus Rokuibacteriota bacterium]|nr:MAG: xanthine dehydrogenase family protein molybdopterin-binding subunit [Candidatus Rokubacteria bacterium]
MNHASFTRRDVLKAGGALVVSFMMPGPVDTALGQTPTTIGSRPPLTPDELDSWVAVLPDGSVTAFFGKMDMGQGVDTAIGQIVADELDVAFDRVQVVMGDTAFTCNQGGASGSTGIQNGGVTLRYAAAEARRLLVERAAQRLAVPVEKLTVQDGVVSVIGDARRTASYGELIGGGHFHHKLDWNQKYGNPLLAKGQAAPKKPSDYTIVGKSIPQKIVTEKVYGTLRYVTDVKVDGMLHARIIRPPAAGCGPVAVDESSIAGIPGVRIVREKELVAVVAEHEWDAVRAATTLKVTWAPPCMPFPTMEKLYDHIREAKAIGRQVPIDRGDAAGALKAASRVVEADYEWPFQSHASMGPACAVADVRADQATVWTGSQKPHYGRDGVAKLLGLPRERVRAIWVPGPGSYGRNDAGDAAMDAALLSRRVGQPVRVQYMRNDSTGWDPKGPAGVYRGRAGLDAQGNVVAYEFFGKGFTRQDVATNESDPKDTLAGQLTGFAPKPTLIFQVPAEAYDFPNKRCGWECIAPLLDRASPLRTGHLRDPLGPETHFASESFIDEVAHAAGADPVAFRLKYVRDPRHAAVIKAAAERARWSPRPSPNPRGGQGNLMVGRGFSYTERNGTIVAAVAEVEVDRRSGRVWAKKFTVAHDCGLIINPKGLELTIEGNVVMAVSRTLFEEVAFDHDQVLSVDWTSYPILEIQDAPEQIDIVLINRPEKAATGAGEPATRTVPAAIANAIFDATGVRIRRVPITPARVRAALARV